MPRKGDVSEIAAKIAADQRMRLRVLRRAVTEVQREAAAKAGVSEFAWNRMERGPHDINPVALARFCTACRVPAGYVITGEIAGMARALAEAVLAMERQERALEAVQGAELEA